MPDRAPARTRTRLRVEPLEDRATPAAYTVTSFADDESPGTLRFALAQVNADLSPDPDTVTFAAAGTVTLGGTPLEMSRPTGPVSISGGGYAVTLDGAGLSRVLEVDAGAAVALAGLAITGGNGAGDSLAGFGGGVLNGGTLSLSGVTVSDNAADFGGGVCNLGTLTVSATTLARNAATYGGGLYNGAGTAAVTASTFAGNAATSGGGLYNGPGGVTVASCTFTGGTADFGGGAYTLGDLALTNSTLSGNAATSEGGGLVNFTGTLTVGGSVVSGNRVTDADGAGPDVGGDGLTADLGYNLFGTAVAGAGATDVRSDAPRLAPLGDYGGPTATRPPLPGGPALDAGDPSDATADQRGVGVVNGRRDIGAFESRGFTLTAAGGSGQAANVGATFADPLVVAVSANAPGEPVAGGVVAFAAPAAGPGAFLTVPAALLDAAGRAGVTAVANGAAGRYRVTATAAGAAAPAVFDLTNTSATSVAVATDAATLTFGPDARAVTATATLTAPGGAMPGGTVTFAVAGPGGAVGAPVTVAVSGGAASATLALPAGTPAGGYTVTATYSGAGGFLPGAGAATLTVVPQATTVDVLAPAVAFGRNGVVTVRVAPAGGGTPTGVVQLGVNGGPARTAALSGGAATFDLGLLPAGSYAFLASYAGDGNYAPAGPAAGALAVTPAGQTITFAPVAPLTYGAGPVTLSASSDSGLPVAFTVVSGPGVVTGGRLAVTGAGTVVLEATQAGDAGRSAAAPARQTVAVGKAVLTVTAGDAAREVGAANPAFTATFAGFVNGDTPSVVSGAPALATTAGPGSVAGAYPVTAGPGTLAAANYTFAFAPGTLTVTSPDNPVPPPRPRVRTTAAGAGTGSGVVVVYDAAGVELRRFQAFEDSFTGGVRVATADVNGDGVDDVVAGAGPGGASVVKVYDGATGSLFAIFTAFEEQYTGGVYVAANDLTGDGSAEVVVTPDLSGGPVVVVYNGAKLAAGANADAQLVRFYGIEDPAFRGGCRAAVGDLNADGRADLAVAAGFGGGPRVALFDGRSVANVAPVKLVPDFFAFEPGLRNGAFVSAGEGSRDIAFGGGPGGGPRVRVFDANALIAAPFETVDAVPQAQLANFFAGDPDLRGGARVVLADANNDGAADLQVGSGTGEPARVRVYLSGNTLANAAPAPDREVDPFGLTLAGGVYVG